MTAEKAEEIRVAIRARFPEVDVVVTPYGEGAEIRVSVEGDRDRRFKIDDGELDSPIIRLLVGASIT
jgi:hypothetical protein